jgi:hypothetical protein
MSLLKYLLWLRDYGIDRFRRALLGVLKAGPIPQHVAFIMDGNRRYAHDKGVKVIQGHVDGFVALRRVRAAQAMIATSPSKKNSFFFLQTFSTLVTGTGNMFDA